MGLLAEHRDISRAAEDSECKIPWRWLAWPAMLQCTTRHAPLPRHHMHPACTLAPPPLPCNLHTPAELTFRLGMVANERCRRLIDAYDACAEGRTISTVWACRAAYDASQACIKQ